MRGTTRLIPFPFLIIIYETEFNRYMNAKKWGKMLHIYVLPIIVKDPWEYVPLARALLAAADTLRPIGSLVQIN